MIEFAKNTFPKEQFKNLDFVLTAAEDIDFYYQFDNQQQEWNV